MNIDDVKKQIEQRTGVPAMLLNGETVEENIARAKALLAYKKQHEEEQPKSTREQFREWIWSEAGIEPDKNDATTLLVDLQEAARLEAGGYPKVSDGGTSAVSEFASQDTRSTEQKFIEWFQGVSAFDPADDLSGFKQHTK
ncbi:MAG: hypothetical protein II918_02510 [Firmicutes bacterium]|nr:hypothetical protein [Bacillota bacterium]